MRRSFDAAGTHRGRQLVLDVALQPVHFGALPGVRDQAVEGGGRVHPHRAVVSDLHDVPGRVALVTRKNSEQN